MCVCQWRLCGGERVLQIEGGHLQHSVPWFDDCLHMFTSREMCVRSHSSVPAATHFLGTEFSHAATNKLLVDKDLHMYTPVKVQGFFDKGSIQFFSSFSFLDFTVTVIRNMRRRSRCIIGMSPRPLPHSPPPPDIAPHTNTTTKTQTTWSTPKNHPEMSGEGGVRNVRPSPPHFPLLPRPRLENLATLPIGCPQPGKTSSLNHLWEAMKTN